MPREFSEFINSKHDEQQENILAKEYALDGTPRI